MADTKKATLTSQQKWPTFYIVPNYDYSVDIVVIDSSIRMHIDGSTVTTMHMQSDQDVIVNDKLVERNRIYKFPSLEIPVAPALAKKATTRPVKSSRTKGRA